MRSSIFVRSPAFYRRVLMVALPVAFQQLITVGVNMMDTIMLGELGELPLSGSALATQVFNLFHFMCMGMGMGASVLTARFWGAKDLPNLRRSITILYRFCLGIASVFTMLALAFPAGLMRLFTEDPAIIREGTAYFQVFWPCFLLYGFSMTTTLVLRSSRQMRVPMLSSIGAFFLNIFFNWVFIFGKLGMPRLEIRGAALGTLISRLFEAAVICGYFWAKDKKIAYRPRNFFDNCRALLPEYVRIGLPVLISDTLLGLGNSMVSVVMGHMGAAFVAANSITSVTQQLSTVFTSGVGQAASILTGNTLGEGRVEQARSQGYTFAAMGAAIGAVCSCIIWLISEPVIGSYNIAPETREIAMQLMHSVAMMTFFLCLNSILTKGVLRGGGDTRFLMVADVFFLWVVSVPLGAAAGLIWHLPAFWVNFCLKCDNLIKAVLSLARLRSGKWIKRISVSAEAPGEAP